MRRNVPKIGYFRQSQIFAQVTGYRLQVKGATLRRELRAPKLSGSDQARTPKGVPLLGTHRSVSVYASGTTSHLE